jgi:AcrR family transcriptional regulator
MRADARRNYDALLAAGKALYADAGINVPFEEVAKKAGVGQGTLYRHFPTREHLFAAILSERVGLLDEMARDLLDSGDTGQALRQWLDLYDQSAAEYRGMSVQLGSGLADGQSPVAAACAPMKSSFTVLLEHAQAQGVVRPDITAAKLLALVSSLPRDPDSGRAASPFLDIVLSGLRPG